MSNENKLLKVIQKRQDAALKKYEGSNAELPRIINTHHEDYRVLDTKFKKLKTQHKETCELLKEKENELHILQVHSSNYLEKLNITQPNLLTDNRLNNTRMFFFLNSFIYPDLWNRITIIYLLTLQVQNKKLIQLSKDRHLGEREKLQIQVSDLNHRVNEQDEIIMVCTIEIKK